MIIEQKSDAIISRAVREKASDIHIIPTNGTSLIQLRIGHQLVTMEKMKNSDAEKLISHFKFRSKMDIGERRRPQNGSLNLMANSEKINLRISTLPTSPHESLAIRILPQNNVNSLEQLSLFKKQISQLRSIMKKANGLFLISGPTSSGKSTTIYSLLLDCIQNRRIITIEDPIEKKTDALIQVEINEKAGVTYEEALKAALRHDPDIIMIGEIRDANTARVAIRAAMTGHLVVSTIHAHNSEGCIFRLKEFGITELDIKETIIGLVSQRLVTLSCPFCGNDCSNYCHIYFSSNRRLAIYEILTGSSLETVLANRGNIAKYEKLPQLISKGIALGYVTETEYERWLY